jgi:hypothetical protein
VFFETWAATISVVRVRRPLVFALSDISGFPSGLQIRTRFLRPAKQ